MLELHRTARRAAPVLPILVQTPESVAHNHHLAQGPRATIDVPSYRQRKRKKQLRDNVTLHAMHNIRKWILTLREHDRLVLCQPALLVYSHLHHPSLCPVRWFGDVGSLDNRAVSFSLT